MTNEEAIELLEIDYGMFPDDGEHYLVGIDAIKKQIPMTAYYEYDDEFVCPACGYEDDGYDVKTLKVCPECGQALEWRRK